MIHDHEVGTTTCDCEIKDPRLVVFLSKLSELCKEAGVMMLGIDSINVVYEPGFTPSKATQLQNQDRVGLNNIHEIDGTGVNLMSSEGGEYYVDADGDEFDLSYADDGKLLPDDEDDEEDEDEEDEDDEDDEDVTAKT